MQGTARPAHDRLNRASLLVVATVLVLALRGAPLVGAYLAKLRSLHSAVTLAGAVAAAGLAVCALTLGLLRRPRTAAAVLASAALAMAVLSGGVPSVLIAAALLSGTLLLGDLVYRALRGREAGPGDLSAAFAAGLVAAGVLVLLLGEAGLPSRMSLAAAGALLLAGRLRRVRPLSRLLAAACRWPRGDASPVVESAWLAFAALVVFAAWAGALAPDVSWDALAYHLPEARDLALSGRVAPLPDLAPQSLLWRNHDAFLGLGFLAGGERVVQLLQFAVGFAVFPAALSLARRLGAAGAGPLVALGLAGFPVAMLQLHSAYVDWAAALLVTAAASQLARDGAVHGSSSGREAGSSRVGGLLLGGAVAAKIFAVFALPALAMLAWRGKPRPSPGVLAAALLCALLPLAPWMLWSQRHAPSVVSPYANSPAQLAARLARGHFFTTSPASGATAPERGVGSRLLLLARLPYDLVFHSSRFEGNGDGYNGILVLAFLLGAAGWGAAGFGRFAAAALPFLVPWSLLYLPSIRFLLPVYPLYAVFTAEGLRRLTRSFSGAAGRAAGAALLFAAALFPVQLSSSGDPWRLALGRMTRAEFLAARLPSGPLWERLKPDDRVLLVGENDRFHCPAAAAWRFEFAPIASWGRDPESWRRGVRELGITHVLWRRDRVPDRSRLGIPDERLARVGENGPAVLYRVRP